MTPHKEVYVVYETFDDTGSTMGTVMTTEQAALAWCNEREKSFGREGVLCRIVRYVLPDDKVDL